MHRVLSLTASVILHLAAVNSIAAQQPNIVVFFSDDAGYADFGFMDQLTGLSTPALTPNLDALAQQSALLSNAYVSSPVCAPSRAGLLTGQAGARFGVEYNIANADNSNDGVPADQVLISERLQQLGYTTGAVGKWHLGRETAKQPQNNGFDEFYGFWGGAREYFGTETFEANKIRRNDQAIDWAAEDSFHDIEPDPTKGRYLTDAFGDEASSFVSRHADSESPFFLYVPFNAPHSPFRPKQQDRELFSDASDVINRRAVLALMYGMDRAIGNVLDTIDDPNRDGDQSDSIADDTIVIFLNDNGGTLPPSEELRHDNGLLKGGKGQGFEGGIRTPMLIRAPGVEAGVFDEAVTSLDLFPTLVAAAGGEQTTPTDGADILPYLRGEQTGQVHEALFWRGGTNYWAIRKGDWKLTKPFTSSQIQLFRLEPDGTGEEDDLSAEEPEMFAELLRDYVNWDVTLDRPDQTSSTFVNRNDRFLWRDDVSSGSRWRGDRWVDADNPTDNVSMQREDSYANTVLIFQPRDNENYAAVNNVSRSSGLSHGLIDSEDGVNPAGLEEFVLNQVRFEGEFAGSSDRSAELRGFPVMFVRSLDDDGPILHLGAMETEGSGNYRFDVSLDVVLHANLIVNGNGDADFYVYGQIRDFDEPRDVTKRGASTLTLTGVNTYAGATQIEGGALVVAGPEAALDGTSQLIVATGGAFTLQEGVVRTPAIELVAGGAFNFEGGVLATDHVIGDLVNSGGTLNPGALTRTAAVDGAFTQQAGVLQFDVGGTAAGEDHDQLIVSGTVELSGVLDVVISDGYVPQDGDDFLLLTAEMVINNLDSLQLPALEPDLHWAIRQTEMSLALATVDELHSDFDADGDVDADDLLIWNTAFGASGMGDADGDGLTGGSDLVVWQREQGLQLVVSSLAAVVPEPSTVGLWLAALLAAIVRRNRRAPHGLAGGSFC